MTIHVPKSGTSCDISGCSSPTTPGTLLALSPFIGTFAIVCGIAATRVFPRLARLQKERDDGDEHYLPASAPVALQVAHAELGAKSPRRRVAAAAFGGTIGLAAVLGELILGEVLSTGRGGEEANDVWAKARGWALGVTVPGLVYLVVVVIPFLEVQTVLGGLGWRFGRGGASGGGKRFARVAWMLQLMVFAGWLALFWSVGRAVPVSVSGAEGQQERTKYGRNGVEKAAGHETFDGTAATIGRLGEPPNEKTGVALWTAAGQGGGLSRACLERIGVIGISLMALLSGFASVSSPWYTFSEGRANRRRPVTEADLARKQSGLDATAELLATKRHRLQLLQRKVALDEEHHPTPNSSTLGKVFGSLKAMTGAGGNPDLVEIKSLHLEISGLETMHENLSGFLSNLRARHAAHGPLGWLLALPSHLFSLYCVYRVAATALVALRRIYQKQSDSFASSDPVTRLLGLLARHWDPHIDQTAWARQIGFLLSGVILVASFRSAVQTFHLLSRLLPGVVLRSARANLALFVGQVAATYVISAALLLRSNLPGDMGGRVGDAVARALDVGFVDRWFEGWFLLACGLTGIGLWVGRRLERGVDEWGEEWEEYGGEEMGEKRL